MTLLENSFFQRSLILILSLSLSGVLSTVGTVFAADPVSQEIDSQIKTLLRRTLHPGRPGTNGTIPSVAEIQKLEQQLLSWKTDVEKILGQPNAPAGLNSTEDYVPIEAKIRSVNTYFDRLASLITLRIATGLVHNKIWREQFALRIPKEVMADFPAMGTSKPGRLGDQHFQLLVDRGEDGQTDPVTLRLSESFVQGLELGQLTSSSGNPNDPQFLTMIQFLATRQLLQNLGELHYLKADRRVTIPQIPANLRNKLESMGMAKEILDEQRQALTDPAARLSIITTAKSIRQKTPAFVTTEYVDALAKILAKDKKTKAELIAPLTERLSQAEARDFPSALEKEILTSNRSLGALPKKEILASLRFFIADAKAITQLQVFIDLFSNGVRLDSSRHARILDIIETRKKSYNDALPEPLTEAWYQKAKNSSDETLYTQNRIRFIETLIQMSHNITKDIVGIFSSEVVDPALLSRTLSEPIAKLSPRQNVKQWLSEISNAGSFTAARDKFSTIMAKATSRRVLVKGMVDPARVEIFVESHDFTPKMKFSDGTNPAMAKQLTERIAAGRKKDIRDLLTIGGWFGFTRIYPLVNPRLSEVLRDADSQYKYFSLFDQEIVSRYPVLNVEVNFRLPGGGMTTKKLFEALAVTCPQATSQRIIDDAGLLIDQALTQAEQNIHADIIKIGNATDRNEIRNIVTSSMMMSLMMVGFPEFSENQERFVEEMLTESLTKRIMQRYVGNYLAYGFGALLLLHVGKKIFWKAGPAVDVVMKGLGPWINGYMTSALALIAVDSVYQGFEVYESMEKKDETEHLFLTGTSGGSLFSYDEMLAVESAYSLTKWMFVARMAMDIAFLWFPSARGLLDQRGSKIAVREFMEDVTAFQKLGLEPGRWSAIEQGIQTLRSSGATATQISEAEQAYLRLFSKVRSGKTWDIDAIRSDKPVRKIDQRLKRIFRNMGMLQESGTP